VAPRLSGLLQRRHWVFDLDGTLTVPMHDFGAFKAAHGLPLDRPILEALPGRADQAAIHAALRTWEEGLADRARPADGAAALLGALQDRGARLGILTRNTRPVALRSLAAAGLASFFPDPDEVIGRDEAPHKPAPDGVLLLLRRWGAPPDDALMVGDYRMDVEAGRAAGAATVYLWSGRGEAEVGQDLRFDGLPALRAALAGR
jgi:HAD superfamily hydrolase (TIGR01509 family)